MGDDRAATRLALALLALAALAAMSTAAAADRGPQPATCPVRSFLLGLAVPDELYTAGLEQTLPLPAVRATLQVAPQVDLALGGVFGDGGDARLGVHGSAGVGFRLGR